MPIEVTTAEGSHLDYPVTIRNVGKAETGKITLALPNWIQAVTPSEMASLAQGDSATILLRFIPTEAMKLNVRVSGQIGIKIDFAQNIWWLAEKVVPLAKFSIQLQICPSDEQQINKQNVSGFIFF